MKKIKTAILAGFSLVLVGVLTGCILPGHHGGKHGLPLPGHHGSHQVNPSHNFVAAPNESPGGNNSPQLVQNQNVQTIQGELHE
jgi:hypothetical protein